MQTTQVSKALLSGQFVPRDLARTKDLVLLGEKPSSYFIRHPEQRLKGNYNVTTTDFVLHNWIRKFLNKAVYVTDMVKTEGKAGARFEDEWDCDPRFCRELLSELEKLNPKLIVFMSRKVERLFMRDERLRKWQKNTIRIKHPAHVVRYRKHDEWDAEWKKVVVRLKNITRAL